MLEHSDAGWEVPASRASTASDQTSASDIINMILYHIGDQASSKTVLPTLPGAQALGAVLSSSTFRSLALTTTRDITVLGAALRSPISNWLSIHVNDITVTRYFPLPQSPAVELLLARLRHLKSITLTCDLAGERYLQKQSSLLQKQSSLRMRQLASLWPFL